MESIGDSDPYALISKCQDLNLDLTPAAHIALEELSIEHAFELLDSVAVKVKAGRCSSPSNYVSATITRGFVPNSSGGAAAAISARGKGHGSSIASSLDMSDNDFDMDAFAQSAGMTRAQEVGLLLSDDAWQAVFTLSQSDASELLETVAKKQAVLRDPSNFVIATIAKGYKSNAQWVASGKGQGGPAASFSNGLDDSADDLSAGMLRVEEVGLVLSDEAWSAIHTLEPQDANELLLQVCNKRQTIRDPSNFVVATVAKGFQSAASYQSGRPPSTREEPEEKSDWSSPSVSTYARPPGLPSADFKPKLLTVPGAKSHNNHSSVNLLVNASPVELKVVELNKLNLWDGQELSVATLLALKCIPEEAALEMLGHFMEKGGRNNSVAKPNSYIQAAVSKILAGSGWEYNSMNKSGNKTQEKAEELGLYLHPSTAQALADMALKESLALLDDAAWQVSNSGVDCNEYIMAQLGLEDPPPKRTRWY